MKVEETLRRKEEGFYLCGRKRTISGVRLCIQIRLVLRCAGKSGGDDQGLLLLADSQEYSCLGAHYRNQFLTGVALFA